MNSMKNNRIFQALHNEAEKQETFQNTINDSLMELLGENDEEGSLPFPATARRVPSSSRVAERSRSPQAKTSDNVEKNEAKRLFPATTNSGVKGRKQLRQVETGDESQNATGNDYATIQGYGSFDGGTTIGYNGYWRVVDDPDYQGDDEKELTAFDLLDARLNEAKQEAQERDDGGYIDLNGIKFMVLPKSSGGPVNYKYVIESEGVKILLHGNAKPGMQPVRVEFGFAALDGRDLYELGEMVDNWLSELGFVVEKETLSRVDLNVTLNVDPQEIFDLLRRNQFVQKAKNSSFHCFGASVETYTAGKTTQICIYDKLKELIRGRGGNQEAKMKAVLSHFDELDSPYLTRVEFRLRRDSLKDMSIDSLNDLKLLEHDLIEFLCREWFRLIDRPRSRGNTKRVKLHPIWLRAIQIFHEHFNKVAPDKRRRLQFRDKRIVRCRAERILKQAKGCLATFSSVILGRQATPTKLKQLLNDVLFGSLVEIQTKGNQRAQFREEVKGYYSPESEALQSEALKQQALQQEQAYRDEFGIDPACIPPRRLVWATN